MRARRAMRFAAGAAAVAIIAGGCGSGQDGAQVSTDSQAVDDGSGAPETANAAFKQAVEDTASATTASYTIDMTVEAPMVDGVTMSASGATDSAAGLASMTLDMSGMATALGGLGGGAGEVGDMAAMFQTPIDVVVEGQTAYVRSDAFGGLFGASTPWVSVEIPAGEHATSIFGGDEMFSATGLLEQLEDAGVDVSEQGTEEIDGVSTTHYAGTATMADIAGRAGEDLAGELPEGVDGEDVDGMMGAFGDIEGEMVIDAWVGDDGIIRRVEVEMSVMGMMSVSYVMDITDVGGAVDIDVPDASEVTAVDMAQLEGLWMGKGD